MAAEQREHKYQLHSRQSRTAVPSGQPVPQPLATETKNNAGVTIYWVDRPGAAQSAVMVGNSAPAWDAEQHARRVLGNGVLGGAFTARLNMNLREDKGYTYGARSRYIAGPSGGIFRATASVKTAVTAPALMEFMREIRGILGDQPISDKEFKAVVGRSRQGYPARFQRLAGVVQNFASADAARRPAGWLSGYDQRIASVEKAQAQEGMADLVSTEDLVILVVGDWNAPIEIPAVSADGSERPSKSTHLGDQVSALGLGPVIRLDDEGVPLPAAETP